MHKEVLAKIRNIDEERIYAFLGYCFILCVIPLLYKEESELAVFHGRQGLALFLCEMAVFILTIVFPFLLKPFLLLFAIFSFWGMVKALNGDFFKLPGIFTLSQRLIL